MDPLSVSYDPALAQQPGILFSVLAREVAPIRSALLLVLAQLAMGCSYPPSYEINQSFEAGIDIMKNHPVLLLVRWYLSSLVDSSIRLNLPASILLEAIYYLIPPRALLGFVWRGVRFVLHCNLHHTMPFGEV